jgi:putative FmdB family regulatory protein
MGHAGRTPPHLDPRDPTGESPFMPIYTYHCNACHTEFDQLVRSETKVACPECNGRKLERLMSLTARPASGGRQPDLSRLGPPPGGGCCGGGCHTHNH